RINLIFLLLIGLFSTVTAQDVSIASSVTTELTVCEEAKAFTIDITNDANAPLTGITLNIAFPQGITYVAGTVSETTVSTSYGVTEANISNLGSIDLNIGNLPKDSTVSMTFDAVAGFDAMAYQNAGNIFRNTMTVNYNSGSLTEDSDPYNILFAALSITQVTPMTKNVFVGGSYIRQVKIVNGGFGRINTLDLHDIYDSTKVKTIATDKGTLNATGSKITLTAADFTTIGNGDGWFDLNETVIITETVLATGCVDAQSHLYATWGCDGQTTSSNSKYPFTNVSLYAPNIKTTAIPTFNTCLDVNTPDVQTILLVNTGSGPANELEVQAYQTKNNGYDLGVFSRIDENSIQYKIGTNGTLTSIVPTSTQVTTNTGDLACLGSNPVGKFILDLPVLQPGDSMFISWNSHTCDNITSCNRVDLIGWDYKVSYTDMCYQNNYNKNNQTGQKPKDKEFSVFAEYPTDLYDGQTGEFSFRLTGATFDMPEEGDNPYFAVKFTIPNGLTWSGNNSDLRYAGGNTMWTPDNVVYNNGVLEAHYPLPAPFDYLNSEFQLDLTGNCGQGSALLAVDMQLSFVMDSLCSPASEIPLTCLVSTATQMHCPGANCIGMGFNGFAIARTSFGLPDNNQDGVADASGSLNMNVIELDRMMVSDTFETTFTGTVHTDVTHPNWQYGYAYTKMPRGNFINAIGARVTVFDQSTGQTLTCDNVPFTNVLLSTGVFGKREIEFDYSPAALAALGYSDFNGFVYEDGDQVTLVGIYKVFDNIGASTSSILITENEFYLSDVQNPTSNNDKYSCDDWNGRFTLIGYKWENYNSTATTLDRCEKNLTQYYKLQVGSGATFNNLFPSEYRNWGHLKNVKVEIPEGYSIVRGRFYQYSTKYTNQQHWQATNNDLIPSNITPIGNGGSIYTYDLAQHYDGNGGDINYSDDGFYGYFRVTLRAICSIPQNTYEDVNWTYNFNESDFLGGMETGDIVASHIPDKVRYKRAVMSLSSTQQTVDGIEPTVEWTVKVKPTIAFTENAFLAFGSNTITVLEVRDNNNNLIPSNNGIYELGNINRNQTKTYKIKASYNQCNLDQLDVFAGYDCDAYPTSLGTSCGYETYPLYINPQPSQLQVRIVGSTPNDPCEPRVTVEIDMLSSKLAYVKDLFVNIDVPGNGSLTLEADSTMVQYPYGSSYIAIANPTLNGTTYNITATDLDAEIGADGLVGITNTSKNRVKLRFNLYMNPNFKAGDFAQITVGGYRPCGLELPSVSLAYDPNSVFTKADNATVGLAGSEDNWATSFGDYDNDGFVDLFLVNYAINGLNQLYHNNGDGTFTKVTDANNPIVTDMASSTSAVWGDYDNDGDLDLFVSNNIGFTNSLYRNEGNGTFVAIQNDPIVNYTGYSHGASWADYDNDGHLDMFVADYFSTRFNKLYHGNGDGTFEEVTSSPVVTDASFSVSAAWGDYDDDGDQDLFVPNTNDENNFLYKNEGNGQFTKVTVGDIVNDGGKSVGASWGDYDNDCDLDLFVANAGGQNNFLYQNNGDGTFTKITNSIISTSGGNSHGSSWADYDNDGDIDLLVTNDADEDNFLYANNGDGTFTAIGNVITQDGGKSFGAAWADVDNDFDLDLHISNHDDEDNFLYLNERGKCSSKACFTFVGTTSNRSAYGSRVKVLATIDGVQRWQMRELTALTGGGIGGQNDQRTLIGLADAAQIDSMVITWSSGIVQKFGAMAVDTCWTITEQDGSEVCGTVYNDANGNCVKDANEDGIPNMLVKVAPNNRQTYTDENGEYKFNLAPGTYTITQEDNAAWAKSCASTSYTLNVLTIGQQYCGNDFADTAACQSPDLFIELATTALRVGFENLYAITFGNDGTEAANNAIIKVDFGQYILPLSASLPWDSKVGTEYTWNIGSVEIGQEFTIYVEDSVSTSATIGDFLTVIGTISDNGNANDDCDGTDNIATDVNEAVGAIDPNDILVSPEGFIAVDQELTYKIRFQNVGNDLVNRVILRDELPEGLDLSTLVRGAASHPYQFRIEGERTLVWEFDNINLPDSTSNEAESHGFATFKITPNVDLTDGTELPNKAAIFFDNSAPIITNTVINTIGEPADVKPGDMAIFPNPMNGYTTIRIVPRQVDLLEEEIQSIEIFTTLGVKIMELNSLTGTRVTIERGELTAGYYIVQVKSNKGILYTGKLLVNK
ncbi:MAG: FG-GAP-like repeat-containing protein, partial [Saprospiraceae bacterium]